MSRKKLASEENSKPRFEFRTFGQDFSESAKLMAELSIPVPEKVRHRQSEELYIVSRANNINNIKIRDGRLDIKTYVQNIQELEQWNPIMKVEFPIRKTMINNDIFPAFNVKMKRLIKNEFTLSEFQKLIEENKYLQGVRVIKERFGYMVNNTICEIANVQINGTKVVSMNSESTEIKDIIKTLDDVKLNNVENINYLEAIKRVIGMINKPLVN
jgi:hypothetical protein